MELRRIKYGILPTVMICTALITACSFQKEETNTQVEINVRDDTKEYSINSTQNQIAVNASEYVPPETYQWEEPKEPFYVDEKPEPGETGIKESESVENESGKNETEESETEETGTEEIESVEVESETEEPET